MNDPTGVFTKYIDVECDTYRLSWDFATGCKSCVKLCVRNANFFHVYDLDVMDSTRFTNNRFVEKRCTNT